MGLNPYESDMDLPALWYHFLITHGVRSRWAKWLAHPKTSMCEWLYWRNILMLPWEGHGWELNTKKNQQKRRMQFLLKDRYNEANF